MINFLKKLFGIADPVDYAGLLATGAVIIDVRTKGEYSGGHVKGSLNIPLNELPQNLHRINRNRAVIVCCASGMRSRSAMTLLQEKGFVEVYNAGGWQSLKKYSL
ncbi:MAG: rhodanese-like protein [Flavipsychrobacter sp.]|jgi:rhodanese-related sulfurtransferase|nr:rhodanese-like protein [Flavipsychrobacter sp.]